MIDLDVDENLKKIIDAPNDKVRDGLAAVFYGKTWGEVRHEVGNKIKCGILTSKDFMITKMDADTSCKSTKYEFCCVTEHFDMLKRRQRHSSLVDVTKRRSKKK